MVLRNAIRFFRFAVLSRIIVRIETTGYQTNILFSVFILLPLLHPLCISPSYTVHRWRS